MMSEHKTCHFNDCFPFIRAAGQALGWGNLKFRFTSAFELVVPQNRLISVSFTTPGLIRAISVHLQRLSMLSDQEITISLWLLFTFTHLHTLTQGDDGFNNSYFDCSQYWEMAPAVTAEHIPGPGFYKAGNLAPSLLQHVLLLFQDLGQRHTQAWPTRLTSLSSLNQIICLNCKSAAN